MTIIIGVDPGLTGALALLSHHGLQAVHDIPTMIKGNGEGAVKNQVDPGALSDLLRAWIEGKDKNEIMVMIESQGPVRLPPRKKGGSPRILGGASAFSLAYTAGVIEGVVTALRLPRELVTPSVWKKALGLTAKGADKKALARAMAQRYYPEENFRLSKSHNRAEAVLIARYGHQKYH
jgi:crossover junction endodeoxyribonuclease RuvC